MTAFALQATPVDAAAWSDLARRAEDAGFAALHVADHPGSTASPFVALAAAATATSTIALGPYVLNCGVRDPLHIASDTATLDVVSGGRAVLGLGAGHTRAEWAMTGRTRPAAPDRIARVMETTRIVTALLAGDTVNTDRAGIRVNEAELGDGCRPVRPRIPLLIGGGNHALLRYAGAHADIVGLSGLGRTLEDGHRHEVRWHPAEVDATIAAVTVGAAERAQPPVLDALVQHVEVTGDRATAATRVAGLAPGLDPDAVLQCPFVMIGTDAQIADQARAHADRWGIERFTVRADAFPAIARVIARLARG